MGKWIVRFLGVERQVWRLEERVVWRVKSGRCLSQAPGRGSMSAHACYSAHPSLAGVQ